MIQYSVVIPAHNEADSLPDLLDEISAVMQEVNRPYEILVVDDGSTDATVHRLRVIQARLPGLRVLCLNKNWGQSAALDAGLQAARGEFVITLDADGQNPPREIVRLIDAMQDEDAILGWRQNRKDTWWKRRCSRLANGIRKAALNDGLHDVGCSLRLVRRTCLQDIRVRLFRGLHRFVPSLLVLAGYRVREVPVEHRARHCGRSHYGAWNRFFGPLVDLLAVYWMKRRWSAYSCEELKPSVSAPGADHLTRAESTTAGSAMHLRL